MLLERPAACAGSLKLVDLLAGTSRQLISRGTPECATGGCAGGRVALGDEVHAAHGIYSSWMNPGCCPLPFASPPDALAEARFLFHAGIDIPVDDAHPDPDAPRHTSHPVYAMESGTVWANRQGVAGCGGSHVRIGHFGYGHTVSRLTVGTEVSAGDLVGWTCLGSWHLHLSEFSRQKNSPRLYPLRPAGRIGPVADAIAPTISTPRLYTAAGRRARPGCASDDPSVPEPVADSLRQPGHLALHVHGP